MANWTEEKIDLIKTLSQKYSDSEIAKILKDTYPNEEFSRNSVKRIRQVKNIKKKREVLLTPQINTQVDYSEGKKKILEWLKEDKLSIGEISRRLDRSKETVIKMLDALKEEGYEISLDEETKQAELRKIVKTEFKPIKFQKLYRTTYKIGLISDTHLCSKFQQITLLHTAYRIMEKEKVDFCIHCGDLVDGWEVYRGQEFEIFTKGIDEQREYAIQNYPKTKKFKTYIVSGNHDYSFIKKYGYNIVRAICREREDLVYRGEVGAKFEIKDIIVELLHPTGGKSYAISYKPQKFIEAMAGDIISQIQTKKEAKIPQIFLIGHYHSSLYFPYLGFSIYAVPCFQATTPYLKARGYHPSIGFWIISLSVGERRNCGIIENKYYDFSSEIIENDY